MPFWKHLPAGRPSNDNLAMPKTTSATPPTKTTTRPAKVDLQIDRALKQRWESTLHTVLTARREGAGAFDELWEAVAAIVEHHPPLYLAGGFATAKAFFQQHLGETERSAKRNMRVAKYASPDEESHFGTSKLDAALGYLEAKTGPLTGRLPVDFKKLRIPVESKDGAKSVALGEATVQQIATATRSLQRAAGKTHPKASPVVTAVQKALSAAKHGSVTVRLAGGHLALSGIPVPSLAAVAKVLAKVKIDPAG